jgi:hypothetical protein
MRRLKRKFSISAPRLSVRPHVPWYIRWAITVPFIVAAAVMIWWAYGSGLELAGFHRGQAERELEGLREQVAELQAENATLSNQAASFERQAQIEHAANVETASQVKALNDEIARLKENLSFFQNLPLTKGEHEGELSILRLKVERDALPGEYHARMILVQSVKQRGKEFLGNMQLVINADHDGKKITLQLPQENQPNEVAAYRLNFKYYQVIDRVFKLSPDVRVESIQVRVFERGIREPKVTQSVVVDLP